MPFAKTGGLADVVGALVRELAQRGHDVRAFMPLYASVGAPARSSQPVPGCRSVAIAHRNPRATAFSVRARSHPGHRKSGLFHRLSGAVRPARRYTPSDPDEHRRFLLFTRAALESCLRVGFAPDIFHCNDWHTAFLPLYLKTVYAPVPLFARSRSVLTIHNIGYQGVMSRRFRR